MNLLTGHISGRGMNMNLLERHISGARKTMNLLSPPNLWGGTFANILPGWDVCQLLVKILPKASKRHFLICIENT